MHEHHSGRGLCTTAILWPSSVPSVTKTRAELETPADIKLQLPVSSLAYRAHSVTVGVQRSFALMRSEQPPITRAVKSCKHAGIDSYAERR